MDAAAPQDAEREARSWLGRRVAHYEVLSFLGAGSMGEVFLVEDTRLGRRAALKLLSRNHDPDHLRRFEFEARAASALNHPNIVTVYDVGVADGRPFLAFELVAGRTLREMMERRTGACVGPGHRPPDREGARRGACGRYRSPRHQARERDGSRGRLRQSPRFRPRTSSPARRWARVAGQRHESTRRHRALHVTRTGPR